MITEGFYQDILVHGNVVAPGNRDCSMRWKAILPFLARYNDYEPLKILDFGANYGYFSFKLAEKFPFSTIEMVDYEPLLKSLHSINNYSNVKLHFEYMDEDRISEFLKRKDYDLILAMSILHHFENPEEIINLFLEAGKTVLFEVGYPNENPVSNPERINPIYEYLTKNNSIQINDWIPHERPLFYIARDESVIKGCIESGQKLASSKTFPEIDYQLWDLFRCKLYPGTLNIKLEKNVYFCNPTPFAEEYRIYPMFLNGFPCYNIRPNHIEYPTRNVEGISPYRLRDIFNLQDGDEVNISMRNEYLLVEEGK